MITTKEKDKDKEARLILWVNLRNLSPNERMMKEFAVYHFERVDRQTSNEGWLIVGDTHNAGLTNVNLDVKIFLITCLQSYYPRGLKYILVPEFPIILEATVRIVLTFANQELRDRIKFMRNEELRQYLDDEQIPEYYKVRPGEIIVNNLPLISSILG